MKNEQTSAEIAKLASDILKRKPAKVVSLLTYNTLLAEAKRLAGSCLTQREADDASA